MTSTMNLLPPSEGSSYESLEELLSAVNQWAAGQGYAIIIQRTKKSKLGVVRKAWLRCDKGGKFVAKGHGKRSTSTRQTVCPFEIIAQRDLATAENDDEAFLDWEF